MSLEKLVHAFRDAFVNNAPYVAAFDALVTASKHATPAERDAAIVALLAPGFEHAEVSGLLCIASGALVEDGGSTTIGLATILDRLAEGAALLAAAGRTVIRAPLGMSRSWGVSLVSPIHDAVREQLVVEQRLPVDEARPILERIAAAARAGSMS